jgi:hypothetical protein
MKKLFWMAVLGAAGYFLWLRIQSPPAVPGAFLHSEPNQSFTLPIPFRHRSFDVYPMANFQVDARVFGKKLYREDPEAQISPVDLALGWGPLAAETVAGQISVSQEGRFYHWHCDELPLPSGQISRHSANMHIIPATEEVRKFVEAAEPGQKISLAGKLVTVRGSDNWEWSSSLTRDDTGEGACEVFYVSRAVPVPADRNEGESETRTTLNREVPSSGALPSTPAQRIVVLAKAKTFQIPHGYLSVPAGGKIHITAEKDSKVKAAYRGIPFWVEKKELD